MKTQRVSLHFIKKSLVMCVRFLAKYTLKFVNIVCFSKGFDLTVKVFGNFFFFFSEWEREGAGGNYVSELYYWGGVQTKSDDCGWGGMLRSEFPAFFADVINECPLIR